MRSHRVEVHRPSAIAWLAAIAVALALLTGCGRGDHDVDGHFANAVASQQASPSRSVRALAGTDPANGRLRLDQVQSFVYAIATNTGNPGFASMISGSSFDLVITGGGIYGPPVDRAALDPGGRKLIVGYIDLTEASTLWEPDLFAGGTRPPWLGNDSVAWPQLYSVQYWHPDWQRLVLSQIDSIVAKGYDGIFLDVLDGDGAWLPGNSRGNPVFPGASEALVALLERIRAHIDAKHLGQPFYLIGNNPSGLASKFPLALKNLDGIFNEWAFYGQSATNGLVSEYKGTSSARYIASELAGAYMASGLPVFGGDYPVALDDPVQVLQGLEFYASLGWVPSVTTALQSGRIFQTGPFMSTAVASRPVVYGRRDFKNYLSGGLVSDTTLVGGDKGDHFLGGPGRNVIRGGAGDDVILAHPARAGSKNKLIIEVTSSNVNGTTPSIKVRVNGIVVVDKTPITVVKPASREIEINVAGLGPLRSVEVEVTGCSYTGENSYSHVAFNRITFNGTQISPMVGSYPAGGSSATYWYSNDGLVTYPGRVFEQGAGFAADTSSDIDGGPGMNSVVYRSDYRDYAIVPGNNGSWTVSSATTAEGPDTLRNIQQLHFRDVSITLGAASRITSERVFRFAAAVFPHIFGGAASPGQHLQFDYWYFAGTRNYLATDRTGGVWMLGPYTDGKLTFIGMVEAYEPTIIEWERR